MNLVIVSGQEATGKSAIGRQIAERLGYRYQSKDTIKEAMFDVGGHSTWDAKWYEDRAKTEFFKQIKQFISDGENAIIESNFIGDDRAHLVSCLNDGVKLSEIYCTASGMTTLKRFIERNETGRRHRGHHDRRWYPKIFVEDVLQYFHIRWPFAPSGLTNKLLIVDSTRFEAIDYDEIVRFVDAGFVADDQSHVERY